MNAELRLKWKCLKVTWTERYTLLGMVPPPDAQNEDIVKFIKVRAAIMGKGVELMSVTVKDIDTRFATDSQKGAWYGLLGNENRTPVDAPGVGPIFYAWDATANHRIRMMFRGMDPELIPDNAGGRTLHPGDALDDPRMKKLLATLRNGGGLNFQFGMRVTLTEGGLPGRKKITAIAVEGGSELWQITVPTLDAAVGQTILLRRVRGPGLAGLKGKFQIHYKEGDVYTLNRRQCGACIPFPIRWGTAEKIIRAELDIGDLEFMGWSDRQTKSGGLKVRRRRRRGSCKR